MPKIPSTTTRLHEGNGHLAPPGPGEIRLLGDRLRLQGAGTLPALALEADLIGVIQRDIATLGVVGERDLGLLVYVTGTSRLLNSPLATVLRGRSSSGKTQIQKRVLGVFPPEIVIDATALTPNALYRMAPGELKNRILATGERRHRQDEDAADANAALRQLLSEGRIAKLCPVKIEGEWKSVLIEQEGPVAYLETTTARSIFAEDLNRMLQVTTDDSEGQTRAVMKAVAQEYNLLTVGNDRDTIIDRHREFQRALQYCDVRIPYAGILAERIPASQIEARRVISQVLATIEAVALLHQFRRDRDGQGRLIATVDDYAVARRLLIGPLHAAIGLGKEARQSEILQAKLKEEFDSKVATKVGGFNDRMAWHRVSKRMVDLGVLQCVAESKGNTPARWRWTGRRVEELVLPSVEAVRNRVTKGPKSE